ncbi:DUF397 domain-containing protein [Streptomyces sp. CB02400]|uniref:DUF397 domain-containing protein n=2 Tax=Streptomyces TaxID=1883 RepID=UPI000D1AC50C
MLVEAGAGGEVLLVAGDHRAEAQVVRVVTGADCVEVADACPTGSVSVRDSKNPSGPVVTVGAGVWQAFVDGLR